MKDLVLKMPLRIIFRYFWRLVILAALLTGLASATGAFAAGSGTKLGIKPVGVSGNYFSLTLAPGETRELTVQLGNFGETVVKARTYAADAYTIVNGGFGAKLDGEPTSGTTRWLDYAADTIELAPGTGVNRAFKVTVPPGTAPGEYITGLAIQEADTGSAAPTGSVGIRQVTRQVIAVAITVPGPRVPRLEIGAATYRTIAGKSSIAFEVKNTGNVRLKPSGEFVLTDANGVEVSRYQVAMDSLYAGTNTFVEIPFAGRLNAGGYTAALTLADKAQHVQAPAHSAAVAVPKPELEGPVQPAGAPPQLAPIEQSPGVAAGTGLQALGAVAGLDLRVVLIGISLVVALGLFGFYFYRRARRSRGRSV